MIRALVLVDGEHYPPVLIDAIRSLEVRGYQIAAAVNLGGGEKLAGPLELGALPIVDGVTQREALERAITSYSPEVVLDLSDDPVVDADARSLLASVALARGVPYQGADFRFDPPRRPRIAARPSIAIISTGKRTGKTAITGFAARTLATRGRRAAIVAMGRGGPAEPRLVAGDERAPTSAELLELSRRGEHASSDVYEDAVLARAPAVGARRAGAGLAGAPFFDTVAAAIEVANAASPDLILLEGSGSAIPPAAADATITVVPGGLEPDHLRRPLVPLRLLLADLIVLTMCEEPTVSTHALSALSSSIDDVARGVAQVRTVFRPVPREPVTGRSIFYATTAPHAVGDVLRAHLEGAHGARVVGMTHNLADRSALQSDLAQAEGTYDVLVTELKAAAVDVATRKATEAGADVIYADNEPVAVDGDLEAEIVSLAERAQSRFTAYTTGTQ
jgi:cyclic 2,3-diphosphoglycerate synthetase